MSLDQLPPLREVIAEHGLGADKRFGQHYLLDLNLTAKIARLCGDMSEATVFEVGPGPGGLTRGLLNEGAARVTVIEKDRRFIPALEQISDAVPADVKAEALAMVEAIGSGAYHPFTGPLKKQDGSDWLGEGETADDGTLAGMNFYVEGIEGDIPQ